MGDIVGYNANPNECLALVQEACDEGSIRPGVDPGLTSRLIFGTVNSLIEWYRPTRTLGADELADAVLKMIFDGLRVHRDQPA